MTNQNSFSNNGDNIYYGISDDNKYENTHNYCTIDKCKYNPKPNIKNNNLTHDIAHDTTHDTISKTYCIGNFCVSCGINMGDCNPRQYCKKTHCPDDLY